MPGDGAGEGKVRWKPLLRRVLAAAGGSLKRKALKRRVATEVGSRLSPDRIEALLDRKARAAGLHADAGGKRFCLPAQQGDQESKPAPTSPAQSRTVDLRSAGEVSSGGGAGDADGGTDRGEGLVGRHSQRQLVERREHGAEEGGGAEAKAVANDVCEEDKAARKKRKRASTDPWPANGSTARGGDVALAAHAGDIDGGPHAGDIDGGPHAGDIDGGPHAGDIDGGVHPSTAAEALAYCKEHAISVEGDGAASFRPCLSFAAAGFDPIVLKATSAFARPTTIQACAWPLAMAGRDVIGIAETGSGKTLGFFLPALMHLRKEPVKAARRVLRVLVLSPTRELAMQTEALVQAAGEPAGVRALCVYGGVPKGPQAKALREGVDVVVATPGRILDLAENDKVADLSGCDYLVLDEADRLLDLGFEKDVRKIIARCAPSGQRQTCMFTATWPEGVRALADDFLQRPVTVRVGSAELTANHRVEQRVEVVQPNDKDGRLVALLNKYHSSRANRVLVFALYKKEAARVEHQLQRGGFSCRAIHGDQSQEQRSRALLAFRDGTCPLLIATDVAARGLDIPDVEVVINFTFPLTIEDYIHRIGRTGRAGKWGISHTLFTLHDKANAGALQNVLREAGQVVPEELLKFGSTVKKKEHKLYGAFGPKDSGAPMKTATKITFDDDS